MFMVNALSPIPVYAQIISQAEHFILTGILGEEKAVPSIRELAASLPANPRTIQKAYGDLEMRGLLVTVPGKGCFVSQGAREKLSSLFEAQLLVIENAARQCNLAGIEMQRALDAVTKGYTQKDKTSEGDE